MVVCGKVMRYDSFRLNEFFAFIQGSSAPFCKRQKVDDSANNKRGHNWAHLHKYTWCMHKATAS